MISSNSSSKEYLGPYEQKYNPEHDNPPKGIGWRKIETGWARGTKRKILPAMVLPISISPRAIEYLKRNSQDIEKYISGNLTEMYSIADDAISPKDNPRIKYPEINKWIVGFADKKKPKYAHKLSAHIAYLRGHNLDFRSKDKYDEPVEHNEKIEQKLQEYIATEQEIIKASGLVDDEGYITLFRNTDENQFENQTIPSVGQKGNYKGNNIESWTTNPNLNWGGTKIMAKIPVTSCIASCIGRRNHSFMYKDTGESEIMICGREISEVMIVGHGNKITMRKLKRLHLDKVKRTLTEHINKCSLSSPKTRQSSLYQHYAFKNLRIAS